MRWMTALMLGSLTVCPTASLAAPISRASLVQYQYQDPDKRCSVLLEGGLQLEFDVVFANEGEDVVAHPLVIFRIPTTKSFGYATVLRVGSYDNSFFAKVVKREKGFVYLAMDGTFLNLFWGSEGGTIFDVEEVNRSVGSPREKFLSPPNIKPARVLMSNGLTCFESTLVD